ncbi:calbindin 1 [Cricetulus griseus]
MAESHLQSSLITASQFFEIWLHFDADGSGYLEGKELQNLIQELLQARKKAGLLAHVLPTEENFLLLFRCQQLKSCEEFMKTWRKYDTDHSGFIETEELKNFLKDLLEKANKTVDDTKLAEYTDLMDGNGYIDENELDALLKDLCEKNKQELDVNNITTYKKNIMALSDGGKLYRTDLALILSAGDN